MAIVVPVVRKTECGTCLFYRDKNPEFGICKFTGLTVITTEARKEACGQHSGSGQIPLPGINPTPLPKGDLS